MFMKTKKKVTVPEYSSINSKYYDGCRTGNKLLSTESLLLVTICIYLELRGLSEWGCTGSNPSSQYLNTHDENLIKFG